MRFGARMSGGVGRRDDLARLPVCLVVERKGKCMIGYGGEMKRNGFLENGYKENGVLKIEIPPFGGGGGEVELGSAPVPSRGLARCLFCRFSVYDIWGVDEHYERIA